MAQLQSTAANNTDLLERLVQFLSGAATLSVPAFAGIGSGVMMELSATPAAVSETWTVTCSAVVNGGTFSVVGSVSGTKPNAAVGVAYDNGAVAFLLRAGAVDFVVGDTFTFTATAGVMPTAERWQVLRYTGAAEISASSYLVNYEPWTAFKGPYHQHGNGWSSAFGQHLNSWLSWRLVRPLDLAQLVLVGSPTINESPRDFELQWSNDGVTWLTRKAFAGITWTANESKSLRLDGVSPGAKRYWRIYVTANGGSTSYTRIMRVGLPVWQATADFDHGRRPAAWLKAPGMTGLDPCFINFQVYDRPTDDYYNLAITGATGFIEAANFDNQPGALAAMALPLWNQAMPFWFDANGQRVVIGVQVAGATLGAYAGKILTFGLPGQYPYPLLVGAPLATASATRFSAASVSCPFKGNRANLKLRSTDGSWKQPYAWPYTVPSGTPKTHRDTNGAYPLLPITLYDTSNTYGVLDGVNFITGFANALGNTVAVDAEMHVVLQDVSRTGINDFYTMRIA